MSELDEYIKREDALDAVLFALVGTGLQSAAIYAIREVPTADVVPRSEVEKIFEEMEKTIRGALVLIGFSYKHNPKEIQCRKECYEDFLGYVAELKKKYTEKKDCRTCEHLVSCEPNTSGNFDCWEADSHGNL